MKLFSPAYSGAGSFVSMDDFAAQSFYLSVLWLLILGLITIPGISIAVRRLHDIGKPWYFMFVAAIPIAGIIILIVDLCKDSDGDNRWGYGPEKPDDVYREQSIPPKHY